MENGRPCALRATKASFLLIISDVLGWKGTQLRLKWEIYTTWLPQIAVRRHCVCLAICRPPSLSGPMMSQSRSSKYPTHLCPIAPLLIIDLLMQHISRPTANANSTRSGGAPSAMRSSAFKHSRHVRLLAVAYPGYGVEMMEICDYTGALTADYAVRPCQGHRTTQAITRYSLFHRECRCPGFPAWLASRASL